MSQPNVIKTYQTLGQHFQSEDLYPLKSMGVVLNSKQCSNTPLKRETKARYLIKAQLSVSTSYSLNCHSLRHIGQWAWLVCELTHFNIQWRWNEWLQAPQIRGQSSPGSLQSGQQPSNGIRHIPHVSSWASHVHDATACHSVFFEVRGHRSNKSQGEQKKNSFPKLGTLSWS